MKTKKFSAILLFLFAFLVTFISCNSDDPEESSISSNPSFISLKFNENDSVPGLENAVFTLEFDTEFNDSIIVNLDSLPYQMRVDSVHATFYFKSTSVTYLIYPNDTINLSLQDTAINFTQPVKVLNYSANGDSSRVYNLKVNVHQVEPELYIWEKLSDNLTTQNANEQKVVLFNNKYFYYLSDGLKNYLYTATSLAEGWEEDTNLTFTPAASSEYLFPYIVLHNNKLYLTTNTNELYETTDGVEWNQVNYNLSGAKIHNLLFSLKDDIWAIAVADDKSYSFASSADGTQWTLKSAIPDGFPIGNYASLVFKSRLGNPKAIVLGGNDQSGILKKTNWSTENGNYWVNLGREDNTLGSVAGAAIVAYDNKLLMFGGMDSNNMVSSTPLRESVDQGLSWREPDTLYNKLPKGYIPRSYQSAVVDENDKRIYLIGGKDNASIYSDVWTLKLNRMYFDE